MYSLLNTINTPDVRRQMERKQLRNWRMSCASSWSSR